MKPESFNLNKEIKFSKGGIVSKVIAEGKESEISLFCMAKGTAMSEHTSGREATVLVLKGKGVFNLAGKEIVLSPGVLVFMSAKTRHSLAAEDNLAFLLYLA
ncbi:MAG: cupin domain-containing protein [Candidatus Ratteibacteria bacterium]|jgi:quercetin dioxygenase-like cupin family protein